MSALIAAAVLLSIPSEPVGREPGPADVRPPVAAELRPFDDPCPPDDDRKRLARCWIDAAYALLGGPPEEADVAFRVAEAESGFRTAVKNRKSSATGLFQFIKSTWRNVVAAGPWFMRSWTIEDRKDGWRNAVAAVWLAGRDGWRTHWQVCSNFTGPGSGPVRCGRSGGWLR